MSAALPSIARRQWPWFAVMLIVAAAACARWRLLDMPLDRDEGEYAYAAQLLLEGVPPYVKVYSQKWPAIFAYYAAILSVFGETARGIHLGLLFVNGITIVLMCLLGRALHDRVTGVTAAACFAVFSLSRTVHGSIANSEHFVLPGAVAGLLVLIKSLEQNRRGLLFISGILLGTAPLVKQQGAVFPLFGLCWVVYIGFTITPREIRKTIAAACLFACGAVAPLLVTILLMLACGAADSFWRWTIEYPRHYIAQATWDDAISNVFNSALPVFTWMWSLWLLAVAGFVVAYRSTEWRGPRGFLIGLVAASAVAVCQGFYFREHYFLLLLPAAALACGMGVSAVAKYCGTVSQPVVRIGVPLGLMLLASFLVIYPDRLVYSLPTHNVARFAFRGNPFIESPEIAAYLREHTKPEDTIAVIGSEPQIYFLSHRRGATGHIYMYPLMERQPQARAMQEEMIREIEAARPAYLVFVKAPFSWLAKPYSHGRIDEWFVDYHARFYSVEGLVEMLDYPNESTFTWGPAAAEKAIQTERYIVVLKRSK